MYKQVPVGKAAPPVQEPDMSPIWKSLLYRVERDGADHSPVFVLLSCHALSRQ